MSALVALVVLCCRVLASKVRLFLHWNLIGKRNHQDADRLQAPALRWPSLDGGGTGARLLSVRSVPRGLRTGGETCHRQAYHPEKRKALRPFPIEECRSSVKLGSGCRLFYQAGNAGQPRVYCTRKSTTIPAVAPAGRAYITPNKPRKSPHMPDKILVGCQADNPGVLHSHSLRTRSR